MVYSGAVAIPTAALTELMEGVMSGIELMRPTIHVQLQVRKIVADSYDTARTLAFDECRRAWGLEHMLYGTLGKFEYEWEAQWNVLARVAKEVDGTYTVTLP